MEHVKYTVTAKTRSGCLYEADSAQQLAILGTQLAQSYCYYWTVDSWPAWGHPQIIVTTGLWTVGQPETILSLLLLLDVNGWQACLL